MFKRRDRRPVWMIAAHMAWPRSGWQRALLYLRYRMRRIPDSPHRIARGVFSGVFVTFTPFFGLHFLMAAGLAMAIRGNVLAALLATFFGNPVTFVPIGTISMNVGGFILGQPESAALESGRSIVGKFFDAWADLWHNMMAPFTSDQADWSRFMLFVNDAMIPYTVGGLIPGLICGLAAYHISLPLVVKYQNRRRKGLVASKLKQLAKRVPRKGGRSRKRKAREARDG